MALTFLYGDYTFEPKPLFTINKEYIKTPAGTGLGTRYNITLEGDLLPYKADNYDVGITGVFSGIQSLRDAFDTDYKPFFLGCFGDAPIVSGHPKITSFDVNFEGDNYVQRASYTIGLNLPTLIGSGFETVGPETDSLHSHGIISYTDDFSLEFTDERVGGQISLADGTHIDMPSVYSVTHNVSAQGEPLSGHDPAYLAQQFVSSKLGFSNEMGAVSGILNTSGVACNNFRTISINKTEGTCNATETFMINPSGKYKEDFELSANTSVEDPFTSIEINGTIQGYANVNYPNPNPLGESFAGSDGDSTPKFQNAITAWSGLRNAAGAVTTEGISGLLYTRANSFYQFQPPHPAFLGAHSEGDPTRKAINTLNPTTLSTAVGYNITEGVITYAYSYNDRPIHVVPDALSETINITENEPTDIFASLQVLGRASGPLLQDMGTKGPRTREISIDAFLPIGTGTNFTQNVDGTTQYTQLNNPSFLVAPTGYDGLISGYEYSLTSTYASVFINSQSKTWQPKIGRFTFQKSWTVGDC